MAKEVNDKIFFAGEHTEIDYFSTAHGAYLSGIREADKIIQLQAVSTTDFDFIDQIVTTNLLLQGCNVNVQNVEVINNSKLTIEAENQVIITSEFKVELGAELDIKINQL